MIEEIKYFDQLVNESQESGCTISEVMLDLQAKEMKLDKSQLIEQMHESLSVMKISVDEGMKETRSVSGLTGGLASKLAQSKSGLISDIAHTACRYALAISEHNACMGRIVAAPTAGSCGIVPGVLLSLKKHRGFSDEQLVMALFNAGAVGMIIAKNANLSGAKGGCAAECGSAGAMAASATVELMGGTPQMCADACALALKAVMGLVCDPVAGLVEVPCVKRNAFGTSVALTSAELALAGIGSVVPADEVIDAMKSVGHMMNDALKETSLGGLAATKTAKRIEKELNIKR